MQAFQVEGCRIREVSISSDKDPSKSLYVYGRALNRKHTLRIHKPSSEAQDHTYRI